MARERLKPNSKRDPERTRLRSAVRRGGESVSEPENESSDPTSPNTSRGAYYYFSAFLGERY